MRRSIFVGLGNPGPEHARNRHNIGFMVIDELARRYHAASWRRAFQSVVTEISLANQRVVLLKPLTYMNESGRAVREATSFYKLHTIGLTVFHDEIELPPARIRVKVGGSDAGHNGLKSISAYTDPEYRRVRLGVGHPREVLGVGHPSLREAVHRYVLSDFSKRERQWVETMCDTVADNAGLLVTGHDASFANKVHLTMQAKGFFDTNDEGAK
ncbi:PTH1 family peptidyl-tRNA hydrolase [Bradyrhizobium sp. i1.8.4]|uniref:aminoacyl-tRNA hydrolase n=1 Tax=unclassified Bradyrhizobium TaxID=2631580 RepID=UPI003D249B9A